MYGTIVCGLKTLRVLLGSDEVPHGLLSMESLLQSLLIWYSLILILSMVFMKFMYICVWKSMRQMNDNLLALVMFNISLFLSLFFCLTIPRVSFPTRNQESLLSSMAKVVIVNFISHKPGRAYSNLVQTKSNFESQLDPPVSPRALTLPYPR